MQVHRTPRAGLPTFSPPGAVTAYRSPDGQTELDALAVAADGLRWAVEIKWRSKALGSNLADVTVFWFTTPEQRKQVGDLIVQATEALVADERQSIDSHVWYRET